MRLEDDQWAAATKFWLKGGDFGREITTNGMPDINNLCKNYIYTSSPAQMAMEEGERQTAKESWWKGGLFGPEMWSHILCYIYNRFIQCKVTTPSTQMRLEDEACVAAISYLWKGGTFWTVNAVSHSYNCIYYPLTLENNLLIDSNAAGRQGMGSSWEELIEGESFWMRNCYKWNTRHYQSMWESNPHFPTSPNGHGGGKSESASRSWRKGRSFGQKGGANQLPHINNICEDQISASLAARMARKGGEREAANDFSWKGGPVASELCSQVLQDIYRQH